MFDSYRDLFLKLLIIGDNILNHEIDSHKKLRLEG